MLDKNNKILIGITGNIASGKSTVTSIFDKNIFHVIDSDSLAKRHLIADLDIREELLYKFGDDILDMDGEIDIECLGKIAFEDGDFMKELETKIHPRVFQDIQKIINETDRKYILIESAIIFEHNLNRIFDKIITVFSDEKVRIDRLVKLRKIDLNEAIKRVKFQMSEYYKIIHSDYVVDNSKDKRWLAFQVKNIMDDICLNDL